MAIRLSFIIAFLLFCLFPAVGGAKASENLWDFEGHDALDGWRFERVAARLKDGAIVIEDGSFPVFYSPGHLNITPSQGVFTLRLKTNKPGLATLSLYSAHTDFTYVVNFYIQATTEFHDYKVYLGDKVPGGEIIYDFAFKLPGNKLFAAIDSIRFHDPGKMELAGIFWDVFWTPQRIEVGSSNQVDAPRFASVSMLTILYFLTVLTIILFIIVGRLRTGSFTRAMLFRSLLVGFALPAVLFTFRMDYNWLDIWSKDRAALAGKSEPERIRAINDGNYDSYFDFIDEMKTIIPDGEKVRPAGRQVNAYDDHVARSVAYHLLPVRSSIYANYLWLYFDEADREVTYDTKLRALKRGDDVVIYDVDPIRVFGGEGALYKKGYVSYRRVRK